MEKVYKSRQLFEAFYLGPSEQQMLPYCLFPVFRYICTSLLYLTEWLGGNLPETIENWFIRGTLSHCWQLFCYYSSTSKKCRAVSSRYPWNCEDQISCTGYIHSGGVYFTDNL